MQAVAGCARASNDLLIPDMIMDPGIDGLDTYTQILNINPNQKAIIVSGFSESDRVKEARALGAGAYLKSHISKRNWNWRRGKSWIENR